MPKFFLLIFCIFFTSIILSNEIWRCKNDQIGVAYYKLNLDKPEIYFMVEDQWKILASNTTKFEYNANKSLIYALSQPLNKAGFVFDLDNKTVYEAYKLGKVKKDYFSNCNILNG